MINLKTAIEDLKATARFAAGAIRAINTGTDSKAGQAEEAARRLLASADLVTRFQEETARPQDKPLEKANADSGFEYLEVRPCIEFKGKGDRGHIESFRSEDDFAEAVARVDASGEPYATMWTIYGMSTEAEAIGDFPSKEAAHKAMNGFISFLASVRTMIEEGSDKEISPGSFIGPAERASDMLTDFINQCSNWERI